MFELNNAYRNCLKSKTFRDITMPKNIYLCDEMDTVYRQLKNPHTLSLSTKQYVTISVTIIYLFFPSSNIY